MNKRERMQAAFDNREVDCVPAAFWHHYEARDVTGLVEEQVDFFRRSDMDFIKIMYEFMFDLPQSVKKASDWYHIKPCGRKAPQYLKQMDVIKGVLDKIGGEAMAFTTMFNAMKMAAWCVGDERMMAHAQEDPQALKAGISAFADTLADWADGFLDEGLDGVFYSAQFGEVGRFDKEQWSELVRPYDVRVLNEIKSKGKLIILHLCGEPDYDFKVHIDRYGDYPMHMVNWAVHANDYGVERGRDFFACPVLGGLDNRGVMLNGAPGEVADQARLVSQSYGGRGFVLGADCSIQGDYKVELICRAVDGAHSVTFGRA